MDKRMTPDRLSGLVLLGFSILLLTLIIPKGVETAGGPSSAGLGPAFMPRLVAALMGCLALALVFQAGPGRPGQAGQRPTLFPAKILLTILVFVGYIIMVPLAGYLVSTLVFLPGVLLFFGVRKRRVIIPLSIGLPLLLYWFFSRVMYVLLPAGILV